MKGILLHCKYHIKVKAFLIAIKNKAEVLFVESNLFKWY